jgi:hypothetical protein
MEKTLLEILEIPALCRIVGVTLVEQMVILHVDCKVESELPISYLELVASSTASVLSSGNIDTDYQNLGRFKTIKISSKSDSIIPKIKFMSNVNSANFYSLIGERIVSIGDVILLESGKSFMI